MRTSSTAAFRGSSLWPRAVRAWPARSPSVCANRSEAPLSTWGWPVQPGALLTWPSTRTIVSSLSSEPNSALIWARALRAQILAASYPSSSVRSEPTWPAQAHPAVDPGKLPGEEGQVAHPNAPLVVGGRRRRGGKLQAQRFQLLFDAHRRTSYRCWTDIGTETELPRPNRSCQASSSSRTFHDGFRGAGVIGRASLLHGSVLARYPKPLPRIPYPGPATSPTSPPPAPGPPACRGRGRGFFGWAPGGASRRSRSGARTCL